MADAAFKTHANAVRQAFRNSFVDRAEHGPNCLGCELDTSSIIHGHHSVVRPTDNNDSGDSE